VSGALEHAGTAADAVRSNTTHS